MPYLVALVIILGLLCLLNLLFTVGVVRRLRDHTRLLGDRQVGAAARPRPMGPEVADFVATTTDGELVPRQSLPAGAVVAFFSPGCKPCDDAVPAFLAYASAVPGGRARVLAVVTEGPDSAATAAYAQRLVAVARVVVEEPGGPVQSAFAVEGSPAFAALGDDHVIAVATRKVSELPELAAVPA